MPLILLVLSSLVLAIKTSQVVKDKEIILSQIKAKGSADTPIRPMTDSDLITARQMIEGYAALYSLPVEVKLEKRDIRIRALTPKPEEGEGGQNAPANDQEKFAVLGNFENVMGFFTSLSNMPYPLEYKDLCVGVDCPNVFEVSIGPRNLAEEQPAAKSEAPAAKTGAPAPQPAAAS